MKTSSITPRQIDNSWVVIDAADEVLGRLASRIVHLLQGKHKPYYVPHLDCGDHIIVINTEKVVLTGNKLQKKLYHKHSGYMGGMKTTTAAKLHKKSPTALLELAIKGMLPKNKLRAVRMKKLRMYPGSEHPHKTQKPQLATLSGIAPVYHQDAS